MDPVGKVTVSVPLSAMLGPGLLWKAGRSMELLAMKLPAKDFVA